MGEVGPLALGLAFVAFTAVMAAFRYREAVADRTFGATTIVASMLSFALGAFAVVGDMQVAAAAGVVTAGILALKSQLHGWLAKGSRSTSSEAGPALLAMTVILLPLLPNHTVDRSGSVNPYELWLMTVMIAVISFVGYVALKYAGDREGIVMTAVAGGLTSSTAATLTLAKLAREHPDHRDPLVAGILLACATMICVLVIVAVINWPLVASLVLPIGLSTATFFAVALMMLRNSPESREDGRTITLKESVRACDGIEVWRASDGGDGARQDGFRLCGGCRRLYAGARLGHHRRRRRDVVDVPAWRGDRRDGTAQAILLVVAVNTVSKTILGWFAGGAETGRRLAAASAAALAAGLFGYWLMRLPVGS